MADLSPKEESLVTPIISEIAREPGLPVRHLGVLIHRNMSVTLRVVQKLVDAGILERRPVPRVRSDRQERDYSGLFLVEGRTTDEPHEPMETPETMGTSEAPVAVALASPERVALRDLGERLGWSRLPVTPAREFGGGVRFGRAIQGGEDGWRQAVEVLSDEDVELALSAGRHLASLMGVG
jgi:hypothetical protein